MLHELTHLPVIVDPSHATGMSRLVKPMALAAAACGADGLMIEVHNNPKVALCDGAQSLTPEQFDDVMQRYKTCSCRCKGRRGKGMTVGIIGLGLIGGSMARAYKNSGFTVLGCDTNDVVLSWAKLNGIADETLTKDNIPDCDLILLAITPKSAANGLKTTLRA